VILVHCWGGCETADVVASVGLSLSDLFPPRAPHDHHAIPRHRPMLAPGDALRLLVRESSIIAIASCDLTAGRALAPDDHARLLAAAGRVAYVARGVS
jgi:hypothetical protein